MEKTDSQKSQIAQKLEEYEEMSDSVLDESFSIFVRMLKTCANKNPLVCRLMAAIFNKNLEGLNLHSTVREALPIFMALDPWTVIRWKNVGCASVNLMLAMQHEIKKIAEKKGWVF